VIIQGNAHHDRPRPYIAPRLYHHDISHYHHDHWRNHGTYFSFGWYSGSCGNVIWAPYHSYWGFSYYYPHYHRKYVFVSIGGYWPTSYRYRRYYWYGCHPHYWYGTHIIAEEPVVYNTYNTYNYYNTPSTTTTTNIYDNPPLTQTTDVVDVIDAPSDENIVDICFAHGVKVFAEGNYTEAIERFRRAVQMDPQDVILPFTYSQALFANGDYAMAASVLRGAIANVPEDELTIYYPRGLYEDEKVLTDQIQCLEQAIAGEPFTADFQLLLGYQYLGLDQLDQARGPLTVAAKDVANHDAAMKLLELADRLEAEKANAAAEAAQTK
jgi:tetratricopeptide (TPR) repeat protein